MVEGSFLNYIAGTDKGEQAVLRRNAGTMLEYADTKAYITFYHFYQLTSTSLEKEEQYFCAACLQCLWKPEELEKAIPIAAAGKNMEENSKKTFEKRMADLLDVQWDKDGYFISKLYRLCRLIKSKGLVVDCEVLLQDLQYWNCDDHRIQRKWAHILMNNENIKPEGDK